MSLHGRVRKAYPVMPPAERRLADLVLNFPGELAGYSASELARMAGTSGAAVTRFVRRLEFSSFDDMRRHAREEREQGSPVYLFEQDFGTGAGAASWSSADVYVDNLRATFSAIDHESLQTLADSIIAAKRVYVIGYRHCFYLAGYLCWSLAHARSDVGLLPRGGETLGESLVDVGSGDVVVAFAFRRRVPALGRALDAVRESGTKSAISCAPGLGNDHGATWVLRCQSRGRGPIDDHGAALAVSHRLVELVLSRDSANTRKRLVAIDGLHDSLSELG